MNRIKNCENEFVFLPYKKCPGNWSFRASMATPHWKHLLYFLLFYFQSDTMATGARATVSVLQKSSAKEGCHGSCLSWKKSFHEAKQDLLKTETSWHNCQEEGYKRGRSENLVEVEFPKHIFLSSFIFWGGECGIEHQLTITVHDQRTEW